MARMHTHLDTHTHTHTHIHTHTHTHTRTHTHAQRLAAAFDFVDDEDWSAGGVDPFAEWDKLDADPDGDDAPL